MNYSLLVKNQLYNVFFMLKPMALSKFIFYKFKLFRKCKYIYVTQGRKRDSQ